MDYTKLDCASALQRAIAQDGHRRKALKRVVQRAVWRAGGWWGADPAMAVQVLTELASDMTAAGAAGRLAWPSGDAARYRPGDGDHRVRQVAQEVCEGYRRIGLVPTQGEVLATIRRRGVRRRDREARRLIQEVIRPFVAEATAQALADQQARCHRHRAASVAEASIVPRNP